MPFEMFRRPPRGWANAVAGPSLRVHPNGKIALRVAALRALGHPERVVFLVDGTRWGLQKAGPDTGHRVLYPVPNQGIVHCAALVHDLHLSGEYQLRRNADEVTSVGVFWEAVRP